MVSENAVLLADDWLDEKDDLDIDFTHPTLPCMSSAFILDSRQR